MKQIYCAFHPKQLIVNFCKNPSCLLPMCPNCVKIHSKQHSTQNTFGEYDNIQDVYEQIQTNLQNVLKNLVNFNQDVKEIFCQKQNKRENIKKRMSEFRVKVITSIQRSIDQLESQILSSMGGQDSSLQEQMNQINQKIELISKDIQKQFRVLSGQKTLKGVITHYSNNMPQFYDDRLDQIQLLIGDLQSKDVSMCKQFKITQLNPLNQKINQLYRSIFVGTIKPVLFKGRQSRISRGSRGSRVSQSRNLFGKTT